MAQSFSPHLILLDLALPDLPGDVAALRMKALKREVPIFALTGHSDPLSQTTTRAVGFTDYITKPFEPDELIRRIEKALA